MSEAHEAQTQVVPDSSGIRRDGPADKCIHQLFEEQVERTPEAVAVVFEDQQLTYRQLNNRSNQLAHYLRSLGVGPETLVAICVERSLEMVVGLLGILKAGGAYVPVDLTYPRDRLAFMLEDAGSPLVLTTHALSEELGKYPRIVLLDQEGEKIGRHPPNNPVVRTLPSALCYVIYTSGSTGAPKGVMVEHAQVVRLFGATKHWFSFGKDDVWTLFHSYAFDFSVWELWGALLYGGRLVVVPFVVSRSPEQFLNLLSEQGVTVLNQTPSAFQQLARAALSRAGNAQLALRLVIFGGEALDLQSLGEWFGAHGDRLPVLVNMYGITETTVHVTYRPILQEDITRTGSMVGVPIPDLEVRLLDEHQNPVPVGVPGEICVSGAGLARGYLNRPSLTASRFIQDPYGPAGARLYRSGDLARYRPDGELEYLGRIDHQVKIRGFRIELGEIEAVLSANPAVRQNVVVAREDTPGDKRLVAYLVSADPDNPPRIDDLRSCLGTKLPDYMVPSAFVVLSAMPLTPNGKIDRKALPAPDTVRPQLSQAFVAPRNSTEEVLVGIWAQVLGLDGIGVHDNFFDLGGHSLLATQVVSRARQRLQIELDLPALFDHPTVARLAEHGRDLATSRAAAIEPRDQTQPAALSFAQQRLWFLDQYESQKAVYNEAMAVQLIGGLDPGVLKRSLERIVQRHESLRTCFGMAGTEPIQVVTKDVALELPVVDLSDLPEDARLHRVEVLAGEEACRPFDLARGPVFRARLLRLSVEEHVLLLTCHHIACDGWSMGILFDELKATYRAFREGGEPELAALPVQYADYAVWQRQWLQGEVLEGQLGYWKDRLAGAPALLELPTDRPRPNVQSYQGAWRSFALPKELSDRLSVFSREQGVSLYMCLLAAFQVLLQRYSRQDDIVVGSPIAGRNRSETENLIGFFVNTLVMRTDLSGDPTVKELLARVREVCLGAYAHQDVPFEKLVEELKPMRSLGYSPLFQVMLVLQNAPVSEMGIPGLSVRSDFVPSGTSKFDLTVNLEEAEGGLVGTVEYSTDLFDGSTIDRLIGHLGRLLEGMSADAEQRISRLPLLTDAERHQLLVEWNDTRREYPADKCVHELFEEQVERTPDAVAVVFEDQQLTYRELNNRSNQLAHYLQSLGVGPETLVGICVERSLEMVVGLLGILKAGGAYVPLDPSLPPERMAFLLQDTQAQVLVADSRSSGRLSDRGVTIVRVDQAQSVVGACRPDCGTRSSDLAYVIFTSGSTGLPKGVCVSHRAVACLANDHSSCGLNRGDAVLQVAPSWFDASVYEIWGTLLNGGSLVLYTGQSPDVDGVSELLRKGTINVALLVSGLFDAMCSCRVEDLGFLRRLVTGGDSLSVASARKCLNANPAVRLINAYGPTEATVISSCYELGSCMGEVVPIGRPISNRSICLLDPVLQLVPVGVAGEIYIGGAGVARGYLNRPELTAEKFIPNPFSDEPGARLYRTGDLARYLPDGNIEFLGRIDHQVKIRGFRIELGEIESVLAGHPGVRQNVVVAREDVLGDKRLVAYLVTADPEHPPAVEDLRSLLKSKVPDYMVPSAFVFLPALPLNPNGKIDRKALPAPDSARPDMLQAYVAPRNPTEEMLAGLWAQVLGLEQAGIHDNFFDLGGHSLLATQVVSRIRSTLHVELPLRSLFEFPTVAGLAEQLQLAAAQDTPAIRPIDRVQPLPVSFAQQRLWFLDQYEAEKSVYNVPLAIQLEGELDVGLLRDALQAVVDRHESLRTRFAGADSEPIQVIDPIQELELPVTDLTDVPRQERTSRAEALAQEEACRPFDLARGPVFRARLLRLAADEHLLLLTCHHIACDGWSMGILFDELKATYRALRDGVEPELPALPVQYADYAVWQREWLQGEVLDRQLAYWKARLAGAPALLELPTDRPRPSMQSYCGAWRSFSLPRELGDRLGTFSREQGVSLYMCLLAAFQVLLQRYSRQDDVVVGSPIAGRNRSETENLIGFFVNTLVMRTDLSGDPTVKDLLARVREVCLGAYAHQDVPFEKLVEELKPARSLGYSPLFQVMLVLQNAPVSEMEIPGLSVRPEFVHSGTSKFDLTLNLEEVEGGLAGTVEYSTDLFDASTIDRLIGHFGRLLEGMVANSQQRISRLPLLTDGERHQLLVEWNDTRRDYPVDKCVHELFEDQVERTPDAVAVVFGDQQLTYRELNHRSNQLAHHLRSLGVGPETRVAICVERSLEMVVGLLGILKAGGAYVPLDPAYPRERLAFMLEDTQAPVVIVSADLRDRLPQPPPRSSLMVIDDPMSALQAHSSQNLDSTVVAGDLAYVMYTSGSTGRPKGVEVLHRGVVRLVQGNNYCRLGPEEVLLQLAPVSFDASTLEIWGSLLHGSRLVLYPGDKPSVSELGRVIRENNVTTLWLTAGLFHLVVDEGLDYLAPLRQLLAGGDVLSPDHVRRCLEAHPHLRLINGYGPTENTTFTCCHTILSPWPHQQSVPIGRPVSNTAVCIVDESLEPVPVGVPGELYTGGAGLARGYLDRPDLTAERFIPDPFSHEPGARLYRTGDLARYLPDGNIEFLGRIDHQVKIRGFRIELGEIESVLAGHPGVRQNVVVAREDTPGDKRLVAYLVTADPGHPPAVEDLRSLLKSKVPDYMVPSAFVFLPALPLTPNGKIDRKALPAPDVSRPDMLQAYVAPRNPTEEVLAGIWADLLGVELVGAHDDFFDLGGHSLLAARLVARISQDCRIQLSLPTIFLKPTVCALAEAVDELRLDDPQRSPLVVTLQPHGTRPPLFLAPGVGGHPFNFRRFAELLGPDRPVHGFLAIGLDGSEPPPVRIENYAARYIREMQVVQPRGPYHLAGYSFGGRVAFEMARQLENMGEQVGLLCLLDTFAPGYPRPLPLRTRVRLHWSHFIRLSVREKQKYLSERITGRLGRVRRRFGLGPSSLPSELSGLRIVNLESCNHAMVKAFHAYKAVQIHADMLVVRAGQAPGWAATLFDDPFLGWRGHTTGAVHQHEIPGDHLEFLKPTSHDAIASLVSSYLSPPDGPSDRSAAVSVSADTCRGNRGAH